MFKALGRLGSQVRSSINIQFFSNLFGSKSKKYDDLGNEDEEVFIDAQEDIYPESDTEEDVVSVKADTFKTKLDSSNDKRNGATEVLNGDLKAVESDGKGSEQIKIHADVVADSDVQGESSSAPTDANTDTFNHVDLRTEDSDKEKQENGSDDEHEDDDDHHLNHKDTTQIVKTPKQSNGLVHSASSAVIQKVHRRMNSYSQRQYSKFDNDKDDENENSIQYVEECSQDKTDAHVTDDRLDGSNVIKPEKKSKRKKKIAKRTRKAVRGSWKWFKLSMVSYAYIFNFSPTFVVTTASPRTK